MRRLKRAFWLTLAVVFLVEAWLWDIFAALGRRFGQWVPYERAKAALSGLIRGLPAWAALPVFIVPVLVILPFKIVALWLIARGHIVLGAAGFIAAKIAGVGVAAFLFELTRDKLLAMPWFARLYGIALALRDWAHGLVAPYREEIRDRLAALRRRMGAGAPGGLGARLGLLRHWARRASLRR